MLSSPLPRLAQHFPVEPDILWKYIVTVQALIDSLSCPLPGTVQRFPANRYFCGNMHRYCYHLSALARAFCRGKTNTIDFGNQKYDLPSRRPPHSVLARHLSISSTAKYYSSPVRSERHSIPANAFAIASRLPRKTFPFSSSAADTTTRTYAAFVSHQTP